MEAILNLDSIDDLQEALSTRSYIADRNLVTAIYLALKLQRPLLLEGEPGVGKTEVAKVVADLLGTELIRLQCYEGLDVSQALYDWDYARQIMHIRYLESQKAGFEEEELFGPRFLLKRPLLRAVEESEQQSRVLLIDEVDRSDEEFEAFLLELLSDFQITIPELGTVRAVNRPVVILTSNRTRELHDALKRRCIYCWIDYPDYETELAIVEARAPDTPAMLASQVTAFIQELRGEDLYKLPGVAETIDWVTALVALDRTTLDEKIVEETLGVILKYEDDLFRMRGEPVEQVLIRARARR